MGGAELNHRFSPFDEDRGAPLVMDATDQLGKIPGGFGDGDLFDLHIR
jgi:hypothetical protein